MIRIIFAVVALVCLPCAAQAGAGDDPALGGRGAFAVGVRTEALAFDGRPDPSRPDGKGGFATATRTLPIMVWYPADKPATGALTTTYRYATTPVATVPAGAVPSEVAIAGEAGRDVPLARGRFPLLVISHGFGNRAVMFSELAERLASKGYVVASIDHGDLADMAVSRGFAFVNTVVHRAADQRLVIGELTRRAATSDAFWSHVDGGKVALAGYSMGGFGALATAGGGYDAGSPLFAQAAPGTAALIAETPPPPAGLRAVIAFAPWGGGMPARAFSAGGLARIALPSLFIAGDEDDVADYRGGIRWLFEQAGGARTMLTYENARHNVATNATPPELAHRFEYRERQDEPVWRKDRMLAINTHMITAFLDWRLKGDAAARRWLDVPAARAVDGTWPLAPGIDAGDRTDGPPSHWPGFQRRWAVGLVMESRE